MRRRGRNLLLSPLDWALIESWQERAVPLHIILGGIERIFDSVDQQPAARRRTVKSLVYCKEEIEAQFAEWLERQVGKNAAPITPGEPSAANGSNSENQKIHNEINEISDSPKSSLFSDDAMTSHLENVLLEIKLAQSKVQGEFQKTLAEVSVRLAKLGEQTSHTAESLEESLEKLDALIDASLLKNYETETLKGEVEKQIASYKSKMEPDVYRRTFDLMLLKRLREQAEIPRLSLFCL